MYSSKMYRPGGKEVEGVEAVSGSFYFICKVKPRVNYWGEEIKSEIEMG